jgi:hypothetical protein
MKNTFTLTSGQVVTTEATHVIIGHSRYPIIGNKLPSGKTFIQFYYDLEMATDDLFKFCLDESDDYTTDADECEGQSDGNVIFDGDYVVMKRGGQYYEHDSRHYSVEAIEELSDKDIVALERYVPMDVEKSFDDKCYEVNMPRSVNMNKSIL